MKLLWYFAAVLFALAGGLAALAPFLVDKGSPGAAGGQLLFGGMALFIAIKTFRKGRAQSYASRRRQKGAAVQPSSGP